MIAQFERPETAKHLYFNLNNSFHLAEPPFSPSFRIAGIYAIYKGDTCYYVGQSKNLPSRISTHLSGKYEECDSVRIYFAGRDGFDDFYERSKVSQKLILENNEAFLIQKLKPIENICVDMDRKISNKLIFSDLQDNDLCGDICVYYDDLFFSVTNDPCEWYFSIDKRLRDYDQEFKRQIRGNNGQS